MGLPLDLATSITQYLMIGAIALVPSLAWGLYFFRQARIDAKQMLFSFIVGGLSVVPMLVWQKSWTFSLSLGGLDIPHINVYQSVKSLVSHPGIASVSSFTGSVVIVGLLMFACAAAAVFFGNLVLRVPFRHIVANLKKRTLEEPFLFFVMGGAIALTVTALTLLMPGVFGWTGVWKAVYVSFWSAMMVGYLEEYSKHLVVRFQGDHAVNSIDTAIQYSIAVGLGFAFIENIIYFLNRIWLAPCSAQEIALQQCLLDPATNQYVHQAGVVLVPYIFRSLLSTVAHVTFSGIFGYYYGVAHFASYELKQRSKTGFWSALYLLMGAKRSAVFHTLKMFQGLLIAMVVHGLFDFVLDQEKTYLTVPILFCGVTYLLYLLRKKENQKMLRLIVDERTSERADFKDAMAHIELLEKFENNYSKHMERKKDPLEIIDGNVQLLEKYEKLWKGRG